MSEDSCTKAKAGYLYHSDLISKLADSASDIKRPVLFEMRLFRSSNGKKSASRPWCVVLQQNVNHNTPPNFWKHTGNICVHPYKTILTALYRLYHSHVTVVLLWGCSTITPFSWCSPGFPSASPCLFRRFHCLDQSDAAKCLYGVYNNKGEPFYFNIH